MKCNNCGKYVSKEMAREVTIMVSKMGEQYPTPVMTLVDKNKGMLCPKCFSAKKRIWKKWLGDG